jgi:hypothetical protein
MWFVNPKTKGGLIIHALVVKKAALLGKCFLSYSPEMRFDKLV